MLVVVENRDIHDFVQALFDDETFGRLDVFEVDSAEGLAQVTDTVDEFIHILGIDLDIDAVNIGEALEKHGLAFHHRLRR